MMQEKMVSDMEVLTLNTVHFIRKYIAFADVNACLADEWQAFRMNLCDAYKILAEHATQLTASRKLSLIFSRYSWVNSFTRYVQELPAKGTSTSTDDKKEVDESGRSKPKTKVNID